MNWTGGAWSRAKSYRKKKSKEILFKKNEVPLPFYTHQSKVKNRNSFVQPFKKSSAYLSEHHDYLNGTVFKKEMSHLARKNTLPKGWKIKDPSNYDSCTDDISEFLGNNKPQVRKENSDIEELTLNDSEFMEMLKKVPIDDYPESSKYDFNIKNILNSTEAKIINERSQINSPDLDFSPSWTRTDIHEDFKRYIYGSKVRKPNINGSGDTDFRKEIDSSFLSGMLSESFDNEGHFSSVDFNDEKYCSTSSPFFKKANGRESHLEIMEPKMLFSKHHWYSAGSEIPKSFEQVVTSAFEDYGDNVKEDVSENFYPRDMDAIKLQETNKNFENSNLGFRNRKPRDSSLFKYEAEKENFNFNSNLKQSPTKIEPPAFFQRKKRRKNTAEQNTENLNSYTSKENEKEIRVHSLKPLKTNHHNIDRMVGSTSASTQRKMNLSVLDLLQINQRNNHKVDNKEMTKVSTSQLRSTSQISVKNNLSLEHDTIKKPLQKLTLETSSMQSRFVTLKGSVSKTLFSRYSESNDVEKNDICTASTRFPSNIVKYSQESKNCIDSNNLNINEGNAISTYSKLICTTTEHKFKSQYPNNISVVEGFDSDVEKAKSYDEVIGERYESDSESVSKQGSNAIPESYRKSKKAKTMVLDEIGNKEFEEASQSEKKHMSNTSPTVTKINLSQKEFSEIYNHDNNHDNSVLNTSEDPLYQMTTLKSAARNHDEINNVSITTKADKFETLICEDCVDHEIKIQNSFENSVPSEDSTSPPKSLKCEPEDQFIHLEHQLKIDTKDEFSNLNEANINVSSQSGEFSDKSTNANDSNLEGVTSFEENNTFSETGAKNTSSKHELIDDKNSSVKNNSKVLNDESQGHSLSFEKTHFFGNSNAINENKISSEPIASFQSNVCNSRMPINEEYKCETEIGASLYESLNINISPPNGTNLNNNVDYFDKAVQTSIITVDYWCQVDVSKANKSVQTMKS